MANTVQNTVEMQELLKVVLNPNFGAIFGIWSHQVPYSLQILNAIQIDLKQKIHKLQICLKFFRGLYFQKKNPAATSSSEIL